MKTFISILSLVCFLVVGCDTPAPDDPIPPTAKALFGQWTTHPGESAKPVVLTFYPNGNFSSHRIGGWDQALHSDITGTFAVKGYKLITRRYGKDEDDIGTIVGVTANKLILNADDGIDGHMVAFDRTGHF